MNKHESMEPSSLDSPPNYGKRKPPKNGILQSISKESKQIKGIQRKPPQLEGVLVEFPLPLKALWLSSTYQSFSQQKGCYVLLQGMQPPNRKLGNGKQGGEMYHTIFLLGGKRTKESALRDMTGYGQRGWERVIGGGGPKPFHFWGGVLCCVFPSPELSTPLCRSLRKRKDIS